MEFKELVQGKREKLSIPLPPIITMLLLQRKLKEYDFDIPLETLRRLSAKAVSQLMVFITNISPEEVSPRAMLERASLTSLLGSGLIDVNVEQKPGGVTIDRGKR